MASTKLAKTDNKEADQFKAGIENEKAKRTYLTAYIKQELKLGTDYDKVGPSPKPTLLKPGAEKFISLMSLIATFKRDDETWEMLGKKEGTVCYVCTVATKSGELAGEGRGVCTTAERQDNPNTAVKIAEKRALVDAVLRVFSLSDAFTQDIEDLPKEQTAQEPSQAAPSDTPTKAQTEYIEKLGGDPEQAKTKLQASKLIEDLKNG